MFCSLARRQEHCSSPGGSIGNVNVKEGMTLPPFREGPVWDPRYQELALGESSSKLDERATAGRPGQEMRLAQRKEWNNVTESD